RVVHGPPRDSPPARRGAVGPRARGRSVSGPDPLMRWWGWGRDADASSLPESAVPMLNEAFQLDGRRTPPVALEDVQLAEPALPAALASRLGTVRQDRL